jgi:hypothetical protein
MSEDLSQYALCGGTGDLSVEVDNGWLAFFDAAFPIVGVAFAVFCIWLAVRIVNRREKWAKRTALALVLAMVYPLSFGPACWITSRTNIATRAVSVIYRPLTWTSAGPLLSRPDRIGTVLRSYSRLLANDGWAWEPVWHFDPARREGHYSGWEWRLAPPEAAP